MNSQVEAQAQAVIRALLDGAVPNGTVPADYGPWADAVAALCVAHQRGGTAEVCQAFQALAKEDSALARLIASGVPKRRTVLHRAHEAWLPRPAKPWLVKELFACGDLVLLVGQPGSGKTWLFLALAVCVALGIRWLNMLTTKAPVLIIDEESGQRRMQERLERTMRGYGLTPGTDVPIFYTTLAGYNFLKDASSFSELRELIEDTRAKLVIIDTLADVMISGDENLPRDIQPVLHGLRLLAEATGAAVLVVHHTNRKDEYRGSSAIPGAIDLGLKLSRARGGKLSVETIKARDIEDASFHCHGEWDDENNTFRLLTADSAPAASMRSLSKAESHIIKYLGDKPAGALKKHIQAQASGSAPGSVKNALGPLTAAGMIKRVDGGAGGSPATYALTESGRVAYAALPAVE